MGGGEGVQESGVRLLWPRTGRDWFVLALAALFGEVRVSGRASANQAQVQAVARGRSPLKAFKGLLSPPGYPER